MTNHQHHTHDNHTHDHGHTGSVSGDGQALCPVMEGMVVDKEEAAKEGRVRECKGHKYYLCCNGCLADFDANPEQYAK